MCEIVATDVCLDFEVYTQKRRSLKETILQTMRRQAPQTSKRVVRALDGITLSIGQGERVGFLGHNGAGKSTLLRTIAGIYRPTAGTIRCTGQVLPLFHSGGSFNSDLTGRENVLQTSALMRVPRETALERVDAILDFAEVVDYADILVKYYSRGMATRLAFATLTSEDPEILLLDEALGGGDQNFKVKVQQRLEQLMDRSSTLLIASHNLPLLSQVCTRILYMQNGRIVRDGDPVELIEEYESKSPSRRVRAA